MPRARAHTDPFVAVADPTRRALLDHLRHGEAAVSELAAGFGVSRPAVSRHLRILRDARLVRVVDARRGGTDGRQRVYEITPAPLREVGAWLDAYRAFWQRNLLSLKHHLDGPPVARPPAGKPPGNPDHTEPPR